jgi:hypothetical protein
MTATRLTVYRLTESTWPRSDQSRLDQLPPHESAILIDHGLQVNLWVFKISASTCIANDLGKQGNIQCRAITASKFISVFTQSRSQSASPTGSILGSMCNSELIQSRCPSATPSSLDPSYEVHLWDHTSLVSKCIIKPAQSWPPCKFSKRDTGCTVRQG